MSHVECCFAGRGSGKWRIYSCSIGRAGLSAEKTTQPGEHFPTPMTELLLPRRSLDIRPAWMIGENDPDSSVMQDDDDPFIPDGITDPPILKAMAKMRLFRQRKAQQVD